MIQHVEDALSHALAMKKDIKHPRNMPKVEADGVLKKYRLLTLGKAISQAKKSQLYSEEFFAQFEGFPEERNWLVHKCIPYHLDEIFVASRKDALFQRIKCISNKAKHLQRIIEDDLIEYSESIGLDMSNVREAIKKHYNAFSFPIEK